MGFSQQILIGLCGYSNCDEYHVNNLRNNFKWFTAFIFPIPLSHCFFFFSLLSSTSCCHSSLFLSVLTLCPFLVWDYQWLMNQSDHTTSAVRISLCCPLLYEWSTPSFTVLARYLDQESTILLINQIELHTLNTFLSFKIMVFSY